MAGDEPTTALDGTFPVASLRHLELRISAIRRTAMDTAVLASRQGMKPWRVEPEHIDQALQQMFQDFWRYREQLGLYVTNAKEVG